MKKIVYIALLIFVIPTIFVYAYTFKRTLNVGDSGEDVYELQKYLNTRTETKISESEIGSPGNETYFFGEKTKQAVIKLQNLFAKEILNPVGLNIGTGFVGKKTIDFLNSISNSKTETVVEQTQKVPDFFVSKQTIKPEETIYVGSNKDLSKLDFYIDSHLMNKKCKHSVYTCSFEVDLKPGTYTLKTSDESLGSYSIKILGGDFMTPKVKISKVNLREDNLIKGDNFSKEIKIYTMYGVFTSKTSNNSFILRFPEEYIANATITEGLFYIENENGLTSNILNIKYEI